VPCISSAHTASKRNSPAAGATQGYIRLLAKRYLQAKNTSDDRFVQLDAIIFY